MYLKVTIADATVDTKSGEKNGKQWVVREQHGFVELNGERRRITIPLMRNANAYAPGDYSVNVLAHLRVGRFGNLELDDRIALLSAAESKNVKAA